MKKTIMTLITVLTIIVLTACGGNNNDGNEGASEAKDIETIVFADAGWDSIRIHNSIAQIIIENGYGYKTDVISGSTATTFQGLRDGDINAYTEIWTDNIKEVYEEALEAGDI